MAHKSLRLSSAYMIIKVKIEFRDDTEKVFDCGNSPISVIGLRYTFSILTGHALLFPVMVSNP